MTGYASRKEGKMRCEKCKSYVFHSNHECFEFTVYDPFDDDTFTRWGWDAEEVAKKLAEARNNDEPIFEDDVFQLPIKITDTNGKSKWFNVVATPEIHYSVNEASEPTEEQIDQL